MTDWISPQGTRHVDWALAYQEAGFYVLPLPEFKKKSPPTGWNKRGPLTADEVRTAWHQNPSANIGLGLPADWVTLDPDIKHGTDGISALEDLWEQNEGYRRPTTFMTRTPSGGQQWVFTLPEGVTLGNSAQALKKQRGIDCDVRGGLRGYGLGQPSTYAENGQVGEYQIIQNVQPTTLPPWLVEILQKPEPVERKKISPLAPGQTISGDDDSLARAELNSLFELVEQLSALGEGDRLMMFGDEYGWETGGASGGFFALACKIFIVAQWPHTEVMIDQAHAAWQARVPAEYSVRTWENAAALMEGETWEFGDSYRERREVHEIAASIFEDLPERSFRPTVEIDDSIDTDEVAEALEAEIEAAKREIETAQARFDDKGTDSAEKKLQKAKDRLEACMNALAGWLTYVATKVQPPYRVWTDISYIAGVELPGAHLTEVEHLLRAVARACKSLEKEFIRTNDGSLLRKDGVVYTMIPPDSVVSVIVTRTHSLLPLHYDPATMAFTKLENLGSLPGQERWTKRVLNELTRIDDADINPISAADWLNTPDGEVWIGIGPEPAEKPSVIWTHSTKVAPAAGPTPMLDTWLKSQFPNDAPRQNRVMAQLGAAMTGRAVREKIAMWWGTGGTGKTSITTALATLLGGYAYTLESSKLEKGHNGHEEWKAELRGRRLVLVDELPESKQLSAQLLKNVSGGGDLSARFLNQKRFTFPAQANLLITANDLPRVASYDPGIRRRFDMVRMDGLASGEWDSVEAFVRALITTEGAAVLAKAIHAYRAAGGWPSEIRDEHGISENDGHFDEMDALKQWLSSGYTNAGSSWTATGVLFTEFINWCRRINAADFSMTQKQFAHRIGAELNQKSIQVQGTGPRGYMLSVLDPLNRSIF